MIVERCLWISPENYLHNLEAKFSHHTWIRSKWMEMFGEQFDNAIHDIHYYPIEKGWVRLRWEHNDFNIEGTEKAIKSSFKIWYPIINRLNKESDDIISIYIDCTLSGSNDITSFKFPKDMIQIIEWAKS